MLRALAFAMSVLVYQGAAVPALGQQIPTRLPFQKTVFYGANFAGEQVDPLTGNLNYTLPLLVIPSDSRSQTALELSYNSQFWHADRTGTRSSAVDVGYGNGWMLMFGAIRDVSSSPNIHSYVFLDQFGTAHPLQASTSARLWVAPQDGLSYDPSSQVLTFKDGARWILGSVSAPSESDAGTLYPTELIDASGKSISVVYQSGKQTISPNTSARIVSVSTRGETQASFVYSSSFHLSSVTEAVTGRDYEFSFTSTGITSPFESSAIFPTVSLTSIQVAGDPKPYAYSYDQFGELAQVVNPHDFALAWTYASFKFVNGVVTREVGSRTIKAGTAPDARTSQLTRPNSDSNLIAHSQLVVSSTDSTEAFRFQTSEGAAHLGLPLDRAILFWNSKISSTQSFTWVTNSDTGVSRLTTLSSRTTDNAGITRIRTTAYSGEGYGPSSTGGVSPVLSNSNSQRTNCEINGRDYGSDCGIWGPDPCGGDCTTSYGSDDDTNVNWIGSAQTIEVQGQFVPIPTDNAPLLQTLDFTPGINFSGDFIIINGVNSGVSVPAEQMNASDLAGNLLLGSTIVDITGAFIQEGLDLTVSEETLVEQLTANKAAGDAAEKTVLDSLGLVKNGEHIASATGTAAYRIPDYLTDVAIGEIKNYTTTLRFTTQIEDEMIFAGQTGRTFELWTRSTTPLANSLQTLISEGQIIHRVIPGT